MTDEECITHLNALLKMFDSRARVAWSEEIIDITGFCFSGYAPKIGSDWDYYKSQEEIIAVVNSYVTKLQARRT